MVISKPFKHPPAYLLAEERAGVFVSTTMVDVQS
jgi:hypothetical protein